MQLSLKKDTDGHISVEFKQGDAYEKFSYSEMIKKLYNEKMISDSETQGSFSQKEIESINELTNELREVILEMDDIVESEKRP